MFSDFNIHGNPFTACQGFVAMLTDGRVWPSHESQFFNLVASECGVGTCVNDKFLSWTKRNKQNSRTCYGSVSCAATVTMFVKKREKRQSCTSTFICRLSLDMTSHPVGSLLKRSISPATPPCTPCNFQKSVSRVVIVKKKERYEGVSKNLPVRR
jgi:hypothetical protein